MLPSIQEVLAHFKLRTDEVARLTLRDGPDELFFARVDGRDEVQISREAYLAIVGAQTAATQN